jgi:hypothetical protein
MRAFNDANGAGIGCQHQLAWRFSATECMTSGGTEIAPATKTHTPHGLGRCLRKEPLARHGISNPCLPTSSIKHRQITHLMSAGITLLARFPPMCGHSFVIHAFRYACHAYLHSSERYTYEL